MTDDRVLDARMSTSDACVSQWPCGPDCCHAAPLAQDDRLWCQRQAPLPVRRLVSVGEECAWFCVETLGADRAMQPGLS